MAEEGNSSIVSPNLETEVDLTASDSHGFYLLSQDEIEEGRNIQSSSRDPEEQKNETETAAKIVGTASKRVLDSPVDVETIKRKAEQIASSLEKFRRKVDKNDDEASKNYEPPEDLKRYRERSLYVAQKLKEDRILFEESKKRNEAVLDKARSVKKIHQNIAENMKELIRDDNDENSALKLRVERLESSVSHLQETLAEKNRVISEKNETIRTLNQTVTETYDSYMHSLEQSKEELSQLKSEYTTTIEEVFKSKEEVQNQLQVIRKKYLSLENDLKLSDFARCRLVSRNAELLETVNQLESKNNDLITKLEEKESLRSSSEDESNIVADKSSVLLDDLRTKIESVVLITNEYQSLVEDDSEIDELNLDNDGNSENVLETIDKMGDKLESTFFTIRDKLASLPLLRKETDKLKDKLKHFEKECHESKTREAQLHERLSSCQQSLEQEILANEELREKLVSVRALNDDWSAKYYDVDKLNEQLQRQLNLMRDNEVVTSMDTSHQVEKLQNECLRLQHELETESEERVRLQEHLMTLQSSYNELKGALEAKTKEYEDILHTREQSKPTEVAAELEVLRAEYDRICQQYGSLRGEYEQLRRATEHADDSNDKYENDFVVLQKRDCDDEENLKRNFALLQQENEKLTENVRSMSQKVIEYENEKLSLHGYVNECKRLQEIVSRLSEELEAANQLVFASNEEKKEQNDSRDEEIEGLQEEMSKLVQQLSQVWDQLHDEKSINENLKEELHYSKNTNAKLSNEVRELQERCCELDSLQQRNEELVTATHELQKRMNVLGVERDQLIVELQKRETRTKEDNEDNAALFMDIESAEKELNRLHQQLEYGKEELRRKEHELILMRQGIEELTTTAAENETLRQELRSTQERVEELNRMVIESEAQKISEFELLSMKANAEQRVQQLQTELDKREHLLKQTQNELQFKALELQNIHEQWNETQNLLNCTQLELQNTREELQKLQHQQTSQGSLEDVLAKCNHEIEGLQQNILDLKQENGVLSEKCESYYTKYMALCQHANEIIGRARGTSDEVVRIIHNLQNQWTQQEMKVAVGTQYDENMAVAYATSIYDRGRYDEIQNYEAKLADLRAELSESENHYVHETTQLSTKNREMNQELTQLHDQLAQVEEELSSRLADIEQYKSIIAELQVQKMVQTVTTDAEIQTTDSESVQRSESPPTLAKYFDYCKDKVTKGFNEILLPEEQPDYSNWILPEKQDSEYKILAESAEVVPMLFDKESQSFVLNADATTQLSIDQPETSNQESQATVMDRDSTTQTLDFTSDRMSVSDVIEKLRSMVLHKYDGDDNWGIEDEDSEWSSSELNINDEQFTNTALKFVALFESVIRYYAIYPETETVVSQCRNVLDSLQMQNTVTKVEDLRETFEQIATLTTRLENENKYLLDTIGFIEDIVANRMNADIMRFRTVVESWRGQTDTDETDVIDRICEEYDIVPAKFVPGELVANWKERIAKSFELTSNPSIVGEKITTEEVFKIFETLKKKMHRLICNMHDAYKMEDNLNPVAFFEQIEDINHLVERAVKLARGTEPKDGKIEAVEEILPAQEVHLSYHDHHEHEHEHEHVDHDAEHHLEHDHEHEHEHHDHDHEHEHHDHGHSHRDDNYEKQKDDTEELRLLLAESYKKIDKLVKELMDVKNSREYNEVQQLHNKLDETLYQLHLRDVHVVELTRELTQLLSERDSLQLKLSNIIRQNEQLRSATILNHPAAPSVNVTDLENKLEELQGVNYMKDPRITEASRQYHAAQMQLISDDQNEHTRHNKAENVGFSVPSLFKWFSSEPETK